MTGLPGGGRLGYYDPIDYNGLKRMGVNLVDNLTKKKRSWNMRQIASRNTKPEKVIRSFLHRAGYRFSLHREELPGKPDIVMPKFKLAIFVHGCFWHQHKKCRRSNLPKSNKKYWRRKFENNVIRDKSNLREIKKLGWKTAIIWECQVNSESTIRNKLLKLLVP